MKVYLYGTPGCHLCDDARNVIWPLIMQYQFRLIEIDIATDDALVEKYGVTIPVLSARNATRELNWPFKFEDVDVFFGELAGI